jgi:hypothetical protein
VPKLLPGFTRIRPGAAHYKGALRVTPKAVPDWTCAHDHFSPAVARMCAEAELERREQGGRQVFFLLRCEPCDRWWTNGVSPAGCPVCSVPLERVKLAVLERGPVS